MTREVVCFNDLSMLPLCKDRLDAEHRVADFVCLIREMRSHVGLKKVRHKDYMTAIRLTEDFSLQDYCNEHVHENVANLLISMFIHPQVDMNDDVTLESYLDTRTELQLTDGSRKEADGFNAAYCQNTFCVGFPSDELWENDFFDISVTSNGKTKDTKWACISSLSFYNKLGKHAYRKPAFDRWLENISPVMLLESELDPAVKLIKLSDDHGKDKLTAHAKLLIQNPYVEGIISSLDFQPTAKRYIWNITEDGIVDIVLWREDVKYSMRVKTTGRNAAETKAIAAILKKKYGKK